jgi:hypothetical protein
MTTDLDDFDEFLLSLRDDGEFADINEDDYSINELHEVVTPLTADICSSFAEFKRWYRIPELTLVSDPLSPEVYPKEIHAIRSMVGDDEVTTTNSLVYAVLCILIGPLISQIIISWDDVQFNKNMFNYAEGWVFLPPSRDSDFESVNRYNRGNGVPFVLDPVKFKDLSCVRKQSAMEQDLSSKFRNLAERAAWTHPRWVTWDSHQWAMLLGIEIFDFMRAKVFPYLFDTEGGCGGSPPWNNLYTAAAAVHRYRGGKAKRGIIGIMYDANALQRGEISPEQAFFTKNLNLAMSGDKRWEIVQSKLERDKHDARSVGEIYEPTMTEVANTVIPKELSAKSATVEPADALTGVAVSFLREKGYILTEMDLVMKVESENRLKAVWGRVPMMEIENQIELRKQDYRDAYLETLSEYSKAAPVEAVRLHRDLIEDPFNPQSLAAMNFYYKIRVEQAVSLSTFIYNERVRVFKLDDVEKHFNRGMKGIKDQFSKSSGSYYRPEFRKSIQHPKDAETFDEIEKWLHSASSLDWLLSQPLPPGVGPDDARIVRNLDAAVAAEKIDRDAFLILIISSDRKLIQSAQTILTHNHPKIRVRVLGMRAVDYLTWCLVREKSPGRHQHGLSPPQWLLREIYNPFRHCGVRVHGPLLSILLDQARFFWDKRSPRLLIEYDLPNLNRSFARYRLHPNGYIEELTGGYLSSGYLLSDVRFPIRPLSEVLELDEFDRVKRRSYFPSRMVTDRPLQLISAVSAASPQARWM